MLKFIHAADIHLDSPLRGLRETAPQLVALQFTLYDQDAAFAHALERVRVAEYAGVMGNHDVDMFQFAVQTQRLVRQRGGILGRLPASLAYPCRKCLDVHAKQDGGSGRQFPAGRA